jgi:hypothetical protein
MDGDVFAEVMEPGAFWYQLATYPFFYYTGLDVFLARFILTAIPIRALKTPKGMGYRFNPL